MIAGMRLPKPRGPLSAALVPDLITGQPIGAGTRAAAEAALASATDVLTDDDVQLSLAICYELHYRGFDDVDDAWEWDPELLRLRARLEERHLAALRQLAGEVEATDDPVDQQLADLIAADDGPSLSRYMARQGSLEQWRGDLTLRAGYHPKEGGPHTSALPPIGGGGQAARGGVPAAEGGGGGPPAPAQPRGSR